MNYFKRYWDEPTGEELTNDWGCSWWYFETDEKGVVRRQIERFDNGQIRRYSQTHVADRFGGLADQALDLLEFAKFRIDEVEFDLAWKSD